MFNDAEIFNQNLSAWDVSNATNFSHMFANAKSFVGFGLGQWKLFGGDDFLVRKSNNLMSDIYSIYLLICFIMRHLLMQISILGANEFSMDL